MVENLPIRTMTHGDLTIEGYSRAAVQSYWRIPELKVGFDLGASPWSFMGTPTFLITHSHLDHMAALPAYVARRKMMKMEPPTIYVPEEIADPVDRMLKAWQKLDRGRMQCTIVPAVAGGEYELSRDHVVTTYKTDHTVPSVGYLIWERRRKLKPEYSSLIPLVSYTGDTSPKGLDECEANYQAKILITEMTFFRPEHRKDKIHKFGHMHLDDLISRAERFQNEKVILAHFSTRYHDDQIRKSVLKKFPESLRDRVELWL
jgi:ribonuclease Z